MASAYAAGVDRRMVVAGIAAAAIPVRAGAEGGGGRVVFYVSVGADLHVYGVDDAALTLSHIDAIRAPEAIQYVWSHPRRPVLYVGYTNRFTSKSDDRHGVATYAIDPESGRLAPFGTPVALASRPINLCVDPAGEYLLVAYNSPSGVTVHRLGPDGTVGDAIAQREPVEGGVYAHQVRVSPDGGLAVLVTRGNDATAKSAEDPGAIKVFRFRDGQLTGERSVQEGTGLGFGPRHVDFHPTRPWMLASLERNNELLVYGVDADGVTARPLFRTPTAARPELRLPEQFAGPIHLHPNGRTVYVANRSDSTVDVGGRKVHGAGENTIAVFALDGRTGEPSLVERVETGTFHNRTFSVHPDGRMLVAASVAPLAVQDGDAVRTVPAGLSVFGIAEDGRLRHARTYDVEVGDAAMFWCGFVR